MMLQRCAFSAHAAAALLAVNLGLLAPATSFGDILLFGAVPQSYRFGEDGTIKRTYRLDNWPQLYEDLDGHVVDPAGGIVYQMANSLGFTSDIPFDVDTGDFLGGQFVNGSGQIDFQPYTGGAADFQFNNGPPPAGAFGFRSGLFNHNAAANRNELFAVRQKQAPSAPIIERLNAQTGAFIQQIPAPGNVNEIRDFNFDGADKLYAATEDGVFAYSKVNDTYGPFMLVVPPVVINHPNLLVPGDILQVAAAPGNSLLVQTPAGTINRHDAVIGAPLGSFLTPAQLGADSIGQFEVSPDGIVYVRSYLFPPGGPTVSQLSRVNGLTGQILSTVELSAVASMLGQMFILPVPEPASASLAFFALALAGTTVRRRFFHGD